MNTGPLLTDAEIRTTKSHPGNMKSDKLKEFRQAAYNHLGKAHDATFELRDFQRINYPKNSRDTILRRMIKFFTHLSIK